MCIGSNEAKVNLLLCHMIKNFHGLTVTLVNGTDQGRANGSDFYDVTRLAAGSKCADRLPVFKARKQMLVKICNKYRIGQNRCK